MQRQLFNNKLGGSYTYAVLQLQPSKDSLWPRVKMSLTPLVENNEQPPCNCLLSPLGALPVPLGQHAQLQTPVTGPPAAPGAQWLQREGLSGIPGPHSRLSGGQHGRRKYRGGGQPGQSAHVLLVRDVELGELMWKETKKCSGQEIHLDRR